MTGLRVLVCGGRDYGVMPKWAVFGTPAYIHAARAVEVERVNLFAVLDNAGIGLLIHGAAKGADRLAQLWAKQNDIPDLPFPADWNDLSHPDALIKHLPGGRKYDARAGHRRNQRMLDEGRPDKVIAFRGGDGTADMVKRAKAAGLDLIEVSP